MINAKELMKAFGWNVTPRGKVVFPGLVEADNMPAVPSGNIFYVDSENGTDDTNHGIGPGSQAFDTIEYALSQCTANNGDVLYVAAGHTETVETDGGLALDIAGVSIIGLGRYDTRPKIVLDTSAAAAVTVTAADVLLQNFVIEASFADITNAIDVTAKGFHIDSCHFQQEGANLNFVDYIHCSSTTDNNADGLSVTRCTGYGVDAAINSPLNIKADLADLVFAYNRFNTDHANALAMIQVATGKDLNNCWVVHNFYASLKTSGDVFIDNDTTANDGWVAHNRAIHLDTAGEVLCDCDGVGQFDNLGTGVVTASGYILPAIDS